MVHNAGMVSEQHVVTVRRTVERVDDGWRDLGNDLGAAGSVAAQARWVVVDDGAQVLDAAEEHGADVAEVRARLARTARGASSAAPRVVRVDDHALFVVVPTAAYDDEQVTTGRLVLLATRSLLVSAESGSAGLTEKVVDRLSEHRGFKGSGALPALAAILVELLAGASDVELALGDAVAHLEQVAFDLDDDPLPRIYNLKREISEARRALLPLSVELPDLGDDHTTTVEEPLRLDRQLLERLTTHAERIDQHLESHDSLLSDMLTVRLSLVSVRQNEDMRKISAWAAIAAVPTLVAGIYGMNFEHMPELTWTWGYPGVLLAMLGICLGLYRSFRHNDWL
jgi:magnesium transporter